MIKVSSSVAVLNALASGYSTIPTIAEAVGMSQSAVQQTLGRLRRKDPAQVQRTNEKGVGVIGTFKITGAGKKVLTRALKRIS